MTVDHTIEELRHLLFALGLELSCARLVMPANKKARTGGRGQVFDTSALGAPEGEPIIQPMAVRRYRLQHPRRAYHTLMAESRPSDELAKVRMLLTKMESGELLLLESGIDVTARHIDGLRELVFLEGIMARYKAAQRGAPARTRSANSGRSRSRRARM